MIAYARSALLCSALFISTSLCPPAMADQNLLVADNGTVDCVVSSRDLTRFSLKDDKFANVSKVAASSADDDFEVVHEPTRGDIYISVPQGFSKRSVSFFGTSLKGYVYKFACRVGGPDSEQVFVANTELEKQAAGERGPALSQKDQAVELIQAMYSQQVSPGFQIQQDDRSPVRIGSLKVQLVAKYVGLELVGKQLLIENVSAKAVDLTDDVIAKNGAVAVSASQDHLEPGQKTTAFVVTPTEGSRND